MQKLSKYMCLFAFVAPTHLTEDVSGVRYGHVWLRSINSFSFSIFIGICESIL